MKLFYSLIAAAALIAGAANAQTWPKPTTSGNFSVRSASVISTGTPINAAAVRDTSAALDVLVSSANGDTALTIYQYLDNGTGGAGLLVSSSSVTATSTPKTVHIAGPLNFQWLKVSPTTAITNTLVSASIIQSK